MAPSWLKHMNYASLQRDQCLLQVASGYSEEIWLELVYLKINVNEKNFQGKVINTITAERVESSEKPQIMNTRNLVFHEVCTIIRQNSFFNSIWNFVGYLMPSRRTIVVVLNLSSSCRAISMDIPDPFSPPLLIVHCFRKVLRATCRIYRGWLSCLCSSCEGVYRSVSLMSLSLLLQQCPTCLVRLTLIVFVMGGKWPYSSCFLGCCLHDLFNIARSILV